VHPLKLRLTDWCQHESKDLTFVKGMNSLQGPNGSGKTNLLEALNLCFSLDTNLPGKKTDCIRGGCQKTVVELEFEHDHQTGVLRVQLTRNYDRSWEEQQVLIAQAQQAVAANQQDPASPLTPEQRELAVFKPRETSKFSLKWGDVECRNATEVAEFIHQRTALDPRVIQTNYFPRQGDVDGVLSGSSEERRRIFAEKAGISLCPKIWDEMGLALRAVPDFSSTEKRVNELEAQVMVSRAAVTQAEASVAAQEAQPQEAGEEEELVRRYMAAVKAQKDVDGLSVELSRVRGEEARLIDRCAAVLQEGKAVRAEYDQLQPQVDGWKRQLWALDQSRQVVQRIQQLQTDVAAIDQQLALAVEPKRPDFDRESVDELDRQVREAQQTARQLDQWLKSFERGVCPTCGQAVTSQYDHHRTARLALDPVIGQQPVVQQRKQQLQQFEQALQQFRTAVATHTARREGLARELAALPPPEQLQVDEEGLRRNLQQFADVEARLQAKREEHAKAIEAHGVAAAQAREIENRVRVVLAGAAGGECPSEEAFRQASDFCTRVQVNRQALREAELKRASVRAVLEQQERDLAAAKKELEKAEPSKRWLSLLSETRALFHRDALPSEVLAWYAHQLASQTQKYLDMFGAGFQLTVSRDLDLLGVFPDKIMPSSRFSGGEKNMTNISMRLALVDLFPSDFNLLVLDEVEVHLDQEKIARLPAILELVKGVARNRGLVVLFISHHPALSDLADHAIRSDGR
jgi:DNA repair exonuclease SbcCD ATPase subunit